MQIYAWRQTSLAGGIRAEMVVGVGVHWSALSSQWMLCAEQTRMREQGHNVRACAPTTTTIGTPQRRHPRFWTRLLVCSFGLLIVRIAARKLTPRRTRSPSFWRQGFRSVPSHARRVETARTGLDETGAETRFKTGSIIGLTPERRDAETGAGNSEMTRFSHLERSRTKRRGAAETTLFNIGCRPQS
jgi:hypothetical protein